MFFLDKCNYGSFMVQQLIIMSICSKTEENCHSSRIAAKVDSMALLTPIQIYGYPNCSRYLDMHSFQIMDGITPQTQENLILGGREIINYSLGLESLVSAPKYTWVISEIPSNMNC